MWHMFQRQNDQIGRCHALVHFINLRCICVCVCTFARDWARCPIPKHSEGSRTQMAMLTSQFSAQRVGGAYLVITLEDLHIVQAWTQILKQLVLLRIGGTYFVITLAHQLTQTIMSASTNTKSRVIKSTFNDLVYTCSWPEINHNEKQRYPKLCLPRESSNCCTKPLILGFATYFS